MEFGLLSLSHLQCHIECGSQRHFYCSWLHVACCRANLLLLSLFKQPDTHSHPHVLQSAQTLECQRHRWESAGPCASCFAFLGFTLRHLFLDMGSHLKDFSFREAATKKERAKSWVSWGWARCLHSFPQQQTSCELGSPTSPTKAADFTHKDNNSTDCECFSG